MTHRFAWYKLLLNDVSIFGFDVFFKALQCSRVWFSSVYFLKRYNGPGARIKRHSGIIIDVFKVRSQNMGKGMHLLMPNGQHLTHSGRNKKADIFKCIFLTQFFSYFGPNFVDVCSRGSNWEQNNIGSGEGLAPNRPQAITWTNNDRVHR